MEWKQYILSSVAGALMVLQIVLIFFYGQGVLEAVRYAGYVLWVVGSFFGWYPIFYLRQKGGVKKGKSYVHTEVLVDTGLYTIVRHPQYLSFFFLVVALILVAQDWVNAFIGLFAMVLFYIDTAQADQRLIEKFGDDYKHYMEKVPRLNFVAGILGWTQRKKRE
jgi:protein-S-isoprenylcysteine O-methyltransferase Ste14